MDICNYFTKDDRIALVAVSLGNSNSKIAYEIGTRLKLPVKGCYNKVYILSFDKDYINYRSIQEDYISEVEVYDYNTENILHLMKIEKSVVVIDNLDHMMEFFNLKKKTNPLEVLEEIYDNNNWIVVLCNMQTSKEYMVKFAQYYPECKFWNDRFMSNEEDKMVLKIHKSRMNEYQSMKHDKIMNYYKENNMKCLDDIDIWKSENFNNAKRFCNAIFTPEVQEEIEFAVEVNNVDEYYNSNKPEKILTKCGGIKNLNSISPKFEHLVKVVNSLPGRHLVYTNFDSYYGSDMIHIIFEKMKISSLILNCECDNEEDKDRIMKIWNNSKTHKVLVVNCILPMVPKNVDHIHILDGNFMDIYEKMFEICNYENCESKKIDITINLHMCERYNSSYEKTIDEYTFSNFYNYLSQKKNFWNSVMEQSIPLKLNRHNRLEV